jgi:hypothetical protein
LLLLLCWSLLLLLLLLLETCNGVHNGCAELVLQGRGQHGTPDTARNISIADLQHQKNVMVSCMQMTTRQLYLSLPSQRVTWCKDRAPTVNQ